MDTPPSPASLHWQRIKSASVQAFHAYASWLVSITWKRFFLLAILLVIGAALLQELPPFSWTMTEHISAPTPSDARKAEKAAKAAKKAAAKAIDDWDVRVNEKGVWIGPRGEAPAWTADPAASGASPASAASGAEAAVDVPPAPPPPPSAPSSPSVTIRLPKGADVEEVKSAVEDAKQSIQEAIADAEEARADAEGDRTRVVRVRLGDYLVQMAMLFNLASAIIKINYKGRLKAEVQAAQATETAESESLKRQVIEARMAAMQAQIEPHFLFNTLASIDHLIEVDPPRASVMQKHLIALLRASMPSMRETGAKGVGHLGRELDVVRPYLEILKVRMEERLQTAIDVPDGLLSAAFPPMMIQGLVENAIKHGLEPKAEGGRLSVKAEIVHGKLAVTVADTGLGFGKAATAGTGVGLANIRERLNLLYGRKAQLAVAENVPSGTRVTITVPYATNPDAPGAGEA